MFKDAATCSAVTVAADRGHCSWEHRDTTPVSQQLAAEQHPGDIISDNTTTTARHGLQTGQADGAEEEARGGVQAGQREAQ